MAAIEVYVHRAFECPHCEAIIRTEQAMYRDGVREVIRHTCPDGHIERKFDRMVMVKGTRILGAFSGAR